MVSSVDMSPRTILSVSNFFIMVASTLVGYTLLSYLSTFISETYIGFAIAVGAAVVVTLFPFLPRIVERYGAQRLALYLAFAEMIMLFAIATLPGTLVSALFVVMVLSIQPIIYYTLDLLLEATVDNEGTTGRVRTLFLTGGSIGALVAPLLIGTLLAKISNYTYIFFSAAAAMVPFIVLFSVRLLPKGDTIEPSHVRDTFKHIMHNRDLAAVTIGHLILYLFYFWAPLYVPIYLNSVLGIPWSTLGWMFSLMLLPYVLIEYPAGWLADRVLGDKELMLVGFIIAGSSLAAVSFLTATSSTLVILFILIATRVGAALVESMNEGHFFRRVSEQDIVSVSIFRGVWPLANVIAPIVASVIIFFGSFQLFFLLTGGFVLIAGTISTLYIRDFR